MSRTIKRRVERLEAVNPQVKPEWQKRAEVIERTLAKLEQLRQHEETLCPEERAKRSQEATNYVLERYKEYQLIQTGREVTNHEI